MENFEEHFAVLISELLKKTQEAPPKISYGQCTDKFEADIDLEDGRTRVGLPCHLIEDHEGPHTFWVNKEENTKIQWGAGLI